MPDSTVEVDAYVACLGAVLRGPRRARADLLTEARDSLVDAAEAYQRAGSDATTAQRRAVADFGTVAQIAPGFQAELAVAAARRTAALLLAVLVPQPVLWDVALAPGRRAGPVPDGGPVLALLADAVEWFGGAAMIGALLALLACGIGARCGGANRRTARATAAFALAAATVLAGCGSVLTAFNPLPMPVFDRAGVLWLLLALIGPLAVVAMSAHRCLQAVAQQA